MSLNHSVLLLLFAILSCVFSPTWAKFGVSPWNYHALGPLTWGGVCKTGQRQSPINLDLSSVVYDNEMWPLKFTNYERALTNLTVKNNGHTCVIAIPEDAGAQLSDGGLANTYELVQIHFHWGSGDDPHVGSEHTLNNLHYPMEAHFVHKKLGVPLVDCLDQSDGLAVLGVMFSLEEVEDNFSETPLNDIYHLLGNIRFHGTTAQLAELKLSSLVPPDVEQFFRYDGSLTTPTCNESVIWTVLLQPLPITHKELAKLGSLFDAGNATLVKNYRPIQPLHERVVRLRLPPSKLYKPGGTPRFYVHPNAAALPAAAFANPLAFLLALLYFFFFARH